MVTALRPGNEDRLLLLFLPRHFSSDGGGEKTFTFLRNIKSFLTFTSTRKGVVGKMKNNFVGRSAVVDDAVTFTNSSENIRYRNIPSNYYDMVEDYTGHCS